MLRTLAEALAVSLLVALLVAGLAWPMPLAPDRYHIGASHNDQASIAWTMDYVARKLELGELPWGRTERMAFPQGASLYPASMPAMALMAPVVWSYGALVALNLLVILHHALAAGATWGWLRREGLDAAGAAAGALGVAFHSALVSSSFNGNPDATPFFWVPAALWAIAAPGLRRAALAGLLAGLGGLWSPYVGVMATAAIVVRLVADRRWRELALGLAIALALGVAQLAFITDLMQARDAAVVKGGRVDYLATASLIGLFRPAPALMRTDAFIETALVCSGAYLGLSLLVAAIAATRIGAAPRYAWGLVATGVVLALGPYLKLIDPYTTAALVGDARAGVTSVPLPGLLLEQLPGLRYLHISHRFTGLAVVGLALLAGSYARHLGRWRWALPAIVAADLLIAAGTAPLLRGYPAWDDGACALLQELPKAPVLDLPPSHSEVYLLAHLCHRYPVAESINQPLPPRVGRLFEGRPPHETARALDRAGFRWVVEHQRFDRVEFQGLFEVLEPCEAARSEEVVVYDLHCMRGRQAKRQPAR